MISLVKPKFISNFRRARHMLGFLFIAWVLGCSQPKQYIEIHGNTMGTSYSIRIVPSIDLQINKEEIQFWLDSLLSEIDRQMSTYRLDSEISIFNSMNKNEAIHISDEFAIVLKRAIYWGEITKGAFDVSVLPSILLWRKGKPDREYPDQWEPPTDLESVMEMVKVDFKKINLNRNNLIKSFSDQTIDLNAIAKGWGVDQIFEYMRDAGMKNFMVEIGGEVRTLGKNNKGSHWKIGIDKPMIGTVQGEEIYSVVSVSNQAMATSGNYRNFQEYNNVKYSHIIDPRTGKPTQSNITSVTVIAPNCMDADALATALNVMDVKDGKALVESLDGIEAFWITKEKGHVRSVATSGMPIDN